MRAHPVVDLAPPLERQEDSIVAAVETFKLLGDVTRLKILWALLHSEHSVSDLADHIGANAPAVSQHLAKLRAARVVRVRRDGNRLFYSADDIHVYNLVEQALSHSSHMIAPGLAPARIEDEAT